MKKRVCQLNSAYLEKIFDLCEEQSVVHIEIDTRWLAQPSVTSVGGIPFLTLESSLGRLGE